MAGLGGSHTDTLLHAPSLSEPLYTKLSGADRLDAADQNEHNNKQARQHAAVWSAYNQNKAIGNYHLSAVFVSQNDTCFALPALHGSGAWCTQPPLRLTLCNSIRRRNGDSERTGLRAAGRNGGAGEPFRHSASSDDCRCRKWARCSRRRTSHTEAWSWRSEAPIPRDLCAASLTIEFC